MRKRDVQALYLSAGSVTSGGYRDVRGGRGGSAWSKCFCGVGLNDWLSGNIGPGLSGTGGGPVVLWCGLCLELGGSESTDLLWFQTFFALQIHN